MNEREQHAEVETAVRLLRAGGVVAFPTETVYGLGADAANPEEGAWQAVADRLCRTGRKMGHINVLAERVDAALERRGALTA